MAQPLIKHTEIQSVVKRLAAALNKDFLGKDPVLLCVLTGAFMFFADLIRLLTIPHQVDFIKIGTYGNSQSAQIPKAYLYPSLSLVGQNVIVIDDILDTGRTATFVTEILQMYQPASLTYCFLLSKIAHREHSVLTPYVGFEIVDKFVYGYGLDREGRDRNLLDIYYVEVDNAESE